MTEASAPPLPDDHGASRPGSGPAEVPVALIVAARKGEPAAFAQVVEHWDGHLRAFVHHTLGGVGPTDRVLAATYLRAYRALPRYTGQLTPGLWLHRIAYLAALDELRRGSRDALRRRPGPGGADRPVDAEPVPVAGDDPQARLARLAPDQRALAVMVDLERYRLTAVAVAFDTPDPVASARLGSARRALAGSGSSSAPSAPPEAEASVPEALVPARSSLDGSEPPADPAEAAAPTPSWVPTAGPPAEEESVTVLVDQGSAPTVPAEVPTVIDASEDLADPVHDVLAALEVPPPGPTFWADLGRRLLAERDQPAAPTPDPVARLARHPAEPGFRPDDVVSDAVSVMADRAERARPRREWGRPLALVVGVLVVLAVVGAAVRFGTSDAPPDGSVPATEVADALAAGLTASEVLTVDATVEEPGTGGEGRTETPYRLTVDETGSWSVSRTDTIDLTAYDTATGIVRSISARDGGSGAAPTVTASIDAGLATGAPDPAPAPPAVLADLQAVGTLLRADPQRRVPGSSEGDVATRTITREVDDPPSSARTRWQVELRRSDGLPVRIELRRDGELVRRTRFARWTAATEAPPGTFDPPVPEGVQPGVTTAGFVTTDLAGVALLGRGEAITPAWLPDGFELTSVSVRAAAPTTGDVATTGDGTNPADLGVASLGFQRGPERLTITTRASSGRSSAWKDPFASRDHPEPASVDSRTLGDGRFNGMDVIVSTDGIGRARLWGVTTDAVLTVSGDLTAAEAVRVAASLRG